MTTSMLPVASRTFLSFRPIGQDDVLLARLAHADGAGIDAAMAGVDDHQACGLRAARLAGRRRSPAAGRGSGRHGAGGSLADGRVGVGFGGLERRVEGFLRVVFTRSTTMRAGWPSFGFSRKDLSISTGPSVSSTMRRVAVVHRAEADSALTRPRVLSPASDRQVRRRPAAGRSSPGRGWAAHRRCSRRAPVRSATKRVRVSSPATRAAVATGTSVRRHRRPAAGSPSRNSTARIRPGQQTGCGPAAGARLLQSAFGSAALHVGTGSRRLGRPGLINGCQDGARRGKLAIWQPLPHKRSVSPEVRAANPR